MIKLITLLGAAALAVPAFADDATMSEQPVVPIEESLTFVTTPVYDSPPQTYRFYSPDNDGLVMFAYFYKSNGGFSVISSEYAGYMEFEGRYFSLRTVPGLITKTGVQILPYGNKMELFYNPATGKLTPKDEDSCLLLCAYQYDGKSFDDVYMVGAYKVSGIYGDNMSMESTGNYPDIATASNVPEAITSSPWTFRFEKIDDFSPEIPSLPDNPDGIMNAKRMTGYFTTWDVDASYQDGILTVDGMAGNYDLPVEFKINLATGKVTATKQVAAQVLYTFYYSDLETANGVLTGIIRNTDSGSVLSLSPWGSYCIDQETFGSFSKYSWSEIAFNFKIPGLTDDPTGGGSDDPDDPDQVKGDGEMTANMDRANGAIATYKVTGTYANGQLTVTNFGGAANPIIFDIDMVTGDVVSQSDQKYNKEYYFTDVATLKYNLYGTIDNISDSQCILNVNTWGTKANQPGLYDVFYNTTVVFDFAIEGLKETPEGGESGIATVGQENGGARYFNLQGIEVSNPAKGEILIKVENEKISKVIIR